MRGQQIAEVRLTPVLISDPPLLNVQGVHQPYTPRLVVEVVTADGTTGIGETYGDGKYLELARPYAGAVIGHDIADLNGLFTLVNKIGVADSRVDDSVDVGGLRGVQTADKLRLSVVSPFEVACLDAWARPRACRCTTCSAARSATAWPYSAYLFYKLGRTSRRRGREGRLGRGPRPGRHRRAGPPAGATSTASRSLQAQGRRLPARAGGRGRPRAAPTPSPTTRCGWTRTAGGRRGPRCGSPRELDGVLEYLEDPAPGIDGMAEVAARARDAAGHQHVRGVLRPHAARRSGRTPSRWCCPTTTTGAACAVPRELAAICETFGIGLSMHSNSHLGISLAAMTHLAAATPNLATPATRHYPWQTEDVITVRHEFREGRLMVSDAPGLGVELDRTELARLHRRWLDDDGTLRDRDDAAAMRRAPEHADWTVPELPRW